MKSGKRFSDYKLNWMAWMLYGVMIVVVCCDCTIVPKKVTSSTPSWVDGRHDSGFINFYTNHTGIISTSKAAEYRERCNQYGTKYMPKLNGNELLPFTNGTWIIKPEHLADFAEMQRWHRLTP